MVRPSRAKHRQQIAGLAKRETKEEAGRKIGAGRSLEGIPIFLPPFSCQLSEHLKSTAREGLDFLA
jgi:hypothetical protein